MKVKKQKFVYITENLINGMKYIGRFTGSLNTKYFGSGTLLNEDIKKYGINNFKRVILEIVNTEKELDEAERKWIKKFDANNNSEFYNLTKGGIGGNTLEKLSRNKLKERTRKFRETVKSYPEDKKLKNSKIKSKNMIEVRKRKDIEEKRIQNFKKTVEARTKDEILEMYKTRSEGNNYCARKVDTPFGTFDCAKNAAKVSKVCIQTVLNRCKNKNFKEWRFLDEKN